MSQITVKEKIIATGQLILSQTYLRKILEVSWKKYDIDTLIRFKYLAVIKKWESYYNLLIKDFKNPYILGSGYMNNEVYMFWGIDRYNKEGFTTQVSNIFTVYNTKYSRKINIVWIPFVFKKIKKEFLYGGKIQNNIVYMERERLFLEYVRDYLEYPNDFFIPLVSTLDTGKLKKYIKMYPIKKVVSKVNSFICI